MHDGFKVDFFGRDQRKTFVQVKAHLVAKHAFGAGTCAVSLENAVGVHMAHEVFVLGTDGEFFQTNRRCLHINKLQKECQVRRQSHWPAA